MEADNFRLLIETGDLTGIGRALQAQPALANQTIRWVLNQQNESDPLHFVSDCVGQGWLRNGTEGEIAKLLLAFGAAIEGTGDRESPLLGSTSLGAEKVSKVLIEAGAGLERTSMFAARALHWAAWVGSSATVEILIAHNANLDARCGKYGATPLFWAVHGYGPNGPRRKAQQVAAAKLLINAGANIETMNKEGLSAIELAKLCAQRDMYELLIGRQK
jgi:ankyrin repeat protein